MWLGNEGESCVVARDYYFEKPNKRLEIVAMLNGTGMTEECNQNCKTLWKAYVYTMSYMKKRVVLVPVASNEKFDGSKIDVDLFTKKINKVFAPLGREYEFVPADTFKNDEVKEMIEKGLNTEEQGNVFNNKTREMKRLCYLYRHDEKVKIDHRADAYVFLLDRNTNAAVKGYMPRTNSEELSL